MGHDQQSPKFGIGAVARITGVAPDTLRIWERRYQVTTPARGQGSRRLYARQDIVRLTLIKQLVDQGNAISTVAGLSEAELRDRLVLHRDMNPAVVADPEGRPLTVVIYGDALPLMWQNQPQESFGIKLLSAHRSLSEFEHEASSKKPDVLVLEFPSVQDTTVEDTRSLLLRAGVERCVLIYGFASKDALASLAAKGIELVRAPVEILDVARACHRLMPERPTELRHHTTADPAVQPPPPKFSSESLARIVQTADLVHCECPRHLVDLIYKLHAFEIYSAECESRDDKSADLHSYLYTVSAQARATMEVALEKVIAAQGIDVEETTPETAP